MVILNLDLFEEFEEGNKNWLSHTILCRQNAPKAVKLGQWKTVEK